MKTAVISIDPNGTASCLWTDDLPLQDFGALDIRRASNVEFNATTQRWEVRLADDPERVAFADPSRSACIAWEIDTLNARFLNN